MVFGVVIDRSLLESPLANAPQIYGYTLLITEFGTEIVALALRHGFHRVIMLTDSAIELYEICLPHTCILCSFALFVYTFLLLIRIFNLRQSSQGKLPFPYAGSVSYPFVNLPPENLSESLFHLASQSCIIEPAPNWNLGGIYFEKNRNYNYKIHRLFSGMGNIGFYLAVIIFKGTSYMEVMGRNYTSIGNSRFYSHLLAC